MRLIRLLGFVVIILLFVTFFMIDRIGPVPNPLNQIRPATLAEAQRTHQVFMPLALNVAQAEKMACQDNLLINGDMETDTGWVGDLGGVQAHYIPNPHGGGRAILTGLYQGEHPDRELWSSFRQTVSLPKGRKATLSLNYVVQVEAQPGADKQFVLVLDQASQIEKLWLLPREHQGAWHRFEQDISRFAGMTVQVYVGTRNDGTGGVTRLLVDNVTLCITDFID